MAYLLDTNIVSYLLKRDITIEQKIKQITRLEEEVFISCITYYELTRWFWGSPKAQISSKLLH